MTTAGVLGLLTDVSGPDRAVVTRRAPSPSSGSAAVRLPAKAGPVLDGPRAGRAPGRVMGGVLIGLGLPVSAHASSGSADLGS
ncbi:hypothetical protein AB0D86_23135 [Streptomyces sp. NPDC048324]|uniref:hypothetical protein n=1 Tax=Streptomyces sp. NPDC048324 TaxID=3157205 RepID=UPI003441B576